MATLEPFAIWAPLWCCFKIESAVILLLWYASWKRWKEGVFGVFGVVWRRKTPLLLSWLLSNLSNWYRGVLASPESCQISVVIAWWCDGVRGTELFEWLAGFLSLHFVLLDLKTPTHPFCFCSLWLHAQCLFTRCEAAVDTPLHTLCPAKCYCREIGNTLHQKVKWWVSRIPRCCCLLTLAQNKQ